MCALIPLLSSSLAQPVLLVSLLGHWNVFVPLAETEEEGRWSHRDLWLLYPPCANLWYQLRLLWAANRIRWLSIRAEVLTLPGHSQTVPTPLTQPDEPLVTHPSSRLRSTDLSFGYIPSNWITPSLQGGKNIQPWRRTISGGRLIKEAPGSSLFVVNLVLGGAMAIKMVLLMDPPWRGPCLVLIEEKPGGASRKPC